MDLDKFGELNKVLIGGEKNQISVLDWPSISRIKKLPGN